MLLGGWWPTPSGQVEGWATTAFGGRVAEPPSRGTRADECSRVTQPPGERERQRRREPLPLNPSPGIRAERLVRVFGPSPPRTRRATRAPGRQPPSRRET